MSSLTRSRRLPAHQISVWDRLLGVVAVIVMQAASYLLFSHPPPRERVEVKEVLPAIPVNILPVMDVEQIPAKLGHPLGKRIPKTWERGKQIPKLIPKQSSPGPAPAKRPVQRQYTSPGGDPETAPKAVLPPSDAKPSEPSPPVDETLLQEVNDNATGGAGNAEEVPFGVPWGQQDGSDEGALQQLAVRMYRLRLIAWFRRGFRVRGSGLSNEALEKLKATAQVHISPDRTVTNFNLTPTGQPQFDAAAQNALEAVRGQELPPPPLNYPGPVQSVITVTFTCAKGTCD